MYTEPTLATWKNQIIFDFSYKPSFIFNYSGLSVFQSSNLTDEPSNVMSFDFINNLDFTFFEPTAVLAPYSEKFYEEPEILSGYINMRKSTFISFFVENLIDIPVCFKKSKSLKNKNFEFFFLKFTNLFMREGKKEKAYRSILLSFFLFFDEINHQLQIKNAFLDWYRYLFSLSLAGFYDQKTINDYPREEFLMIFQHFYKDQKKDINFEADVKSLIGKNLSQISPMFLYFVYNVDKNVRKFSRGKSGKYVFVWKYVAPYKRKFLMFKWLLKEIKFDDSRTLDTRLSNFFNTLFFNIKDTHAWKAKNFTYSFIFKNFRKTFMLSLKTTLKK